MNVDVIIIGSGQAGVPLATKLAAAGQQVMLIERGDLGGTCVNTGCTPTKTMIASARAAHVARSGERLGVRTGQVEVDLVAIVRRKDDMVRRWREGVARRIVEAGERLLFVQGHARFVGERTVEVANDRHSAASVVINVGARAAVPRVAGIDDVPWLDHGRLMDLQALPRHLLVLGGGYIGCELGQMFGRFGAPVTIVEHGAHLLGREDPEVSQALEAALRAEHIDLELGTSVERVSASGGTITLELANGKRLSGSHLLAAVGRRPNTDDLGCSAAGVDLDAHGFVDIDDQYRTSAPGVYAVGDATGEPQFTHVAWDDHRILFRLLTGQSTRGRQGRHYPYTAYTDPQVAGVGLTEQEARARGVAYELASMPFGHIARAIETDETAGVVRVLVDPASDRVLGASIVGAEAGELIHVFVTLMQAQASVRAIVDAEFVHPSFAEGVQSALLKLARLNG
jgi:pyruvate/2-oxoglutarate dehydrogenase complex dihydrolipoamide dehydrogenase (E3) component